ncbi:MAG: hypothetical protein C0392_07460 [Syntrophus sp. (in: bacteria)]|nr:hypothetical protein [Syntrophus sp. (in: bacteria)]
MAPLSNSHLNDILPDFQSFLIDNKLADDRYVAFYALRVSQFLSFANRNMESDADALVDKFLDHLKTRENISEWHVKQAQDALGLYLYLNVRRRTRAEQSGVDGVFTSCQGPSTK